MSSLFRTGCHHNFPTRTQFPPCVSACAAPPPPLLSSRPNPPLQIRPLWLLFGETFQDAGASLGPLSRGDPSFFICENKEDRDHAVLGSRRLDKLGGFLDNADGSSDYERSRNAPKLEALAEIREEEETKMA